MEKIENVSYVQAQQQQMNRSEVATNIRATDDLRHQIYQSRERLNEQLMTTRDLNVSAINEQRKELFDLEDRIERFSKNLISSSQNSTAAISTAERQQIIGLYQSRLYTQSQIAKQYGITQSAVSQIVR